MSVWMKRAESFWERYDREEDELEKYGECVCVY